MNKKENWNSVRTVRGLMNSNSEGLSHFPKMMESMIDNKAWMDFTTPQGDRFLYTKWQFIDFIKAKPEAGLGASDESIILDLCKNDGKVYAKVLKLFKKKPGPKTRTDNLFANSKGIKAPTGTTKANAIRRLGKTRDDLEVKVLTGKMTANAAMIQAGFRKPMASVPKTKEGFVAYIKRTFTPSEIRWIKEQL